jgi:Winged helix-turn-helix DNA-binding
VSLAPGLLLVEIYGRSGAAPVSELALFLHPCPALTSAISGTFGIVGCADTGLVLARAPQGATLYARSRDIEEVEHAISFSKDTCRWTILGEAAEVQMSETRKKILGVLQKAKEPTGPNDIADAADLSRDVVRKRLGDMVEKGEVTLVARGRYAAPSYVPITTVTSSPSSSSK